MVSIRTATAGSERYTNATIRMAYDVETEDGVIGYTAGFWMAYVLGATGEDFPPVWTDDVTYRDEWWTRR